ncbi:MAG TPA: hypothetical protein VLB81_03470 [Gaiellales bacterium]|jgi:hypothetical protein|nr:hypothetical protein [Gaiellales bacterium]
MPAFAIRRVDGRWRVRAAGCCDPASHRREYERAYMEQVLEEGGSVVRREGDVVHLVDRRGRPCSVDLGM